MSAQPFFNAFFFTRPIIQIFIIASNDLSDLGLSGIFCLFLKVKILFEIIDGQGLAHL